jgi:hypothetical protein
MQSAERGKRIARIRESAWGILGSTALDRVLPSRLWPSIGSHAQALAISVPSRSGSWWFAVTVCLPERDGEG